VLISPSYNFNFEEIIQTDDYDFHFGAISDFEPVFYSGDILESELTLSQYFSLDFYSGDYVDIEFVIFPSHNFEPVFYSGDNLESELTLSQYFSLDFYSGDILYPELTTYLPQTIEIDFYSGDSLESSIKFAKPILLFPKKILEGSFFNVTESVSEIWGFNFCPKKTDPIYNDIVLRSDFLKIELDKRRNIWDYCPIVVDVFHVDLATGKRFQVGFYSGDNVNPYLPEKYTSFGSFTENELQGGLVLDIDQKSSLPRIETDTNFIVDFEPRITFRFCKGYITPVGDNIVLEISKTYDKECNITYFYSGDGFTSNLNISEYSLSVDISNIENFIAVLTVYPHENVIMEPRFFSGDNIFVPSDARFDVSYYDGINMTTMFYDEPTLFYSGDNFSIELSETGATIEWITEDGCLPNQYIYLDEYGDEDLENTPEFNDVAVEFFNYKTKVEAKCVRFTILEL